MESKAAPSIGWSGVIAASRPFILGGISGILATTVVQPMDYVKTRLQLMGEGQKSAHAASPIRVAKDIVRVQGVAALYTGISAAYARQIVYGSARLGLFRTFSDMFKEMNAGGPVPVWQKMVAGLGAGAIASFIGNPTELALIRMQADATLPVEQRRHYKGVVDATLRVIREEGVTELWRGSTPTVARAMALNMAMLATADQMKETFASQLGGQNSKTNLVVSSVVSGIAASVASLPFDLVKTRLQKMRPKADGTMPYRGFFDCTKQILANEGPLAFYKGLSTYIFRISPHVIITLIVLDYLNKAVDRLLLK